MLEILIYTVEMLHDSVFYKFTIDIDMVLLQYRVAGNWIRPRSPVTSQTL